MGKASDARERELTLVKETTEAQPKDGEVQSYLGLLYAKKGMRDDASRHLQAALALGADNQEVLENIAEGYEHLGRRREAVQYLEKAVAKGYPMEDLRTNPAVASLLADPSFRAK
jgi:Flp pilus assembly protein TadD